MGLYGDLSYSAPKSGYVDPGVEQFFKATTAIQGKHDTMATGFDALAELNDNLKNTVHTSAADQEAARKIMEASDATIKDAVARGDFANLERELRKAGRDWTSKVTPLKENYKAIQEYNKIKQELGESGIDFKPADNFATYNPDGTQNRFTHDVQKRLEYDVKMRQMMALKADSMPTSLKGTDFAYILKHGSIEEISDDKIRNYAKDVFGAYKETSEYKQQFRVLTELGDNPMDAQTAENTIAKQLLTVGMGQEYKKQDANYMQNSAQADLDKSAAAAAAEQPMQSVWAGIVHKAFTLNPDGEAYTSTNTENLANMMPGNAITVNNGDGTSFKAVNVPGPKILSFAELSPETMYNLNTAEGLAATKYYQEALPLEAKKKELEDRLAAHKKHPSAINDNIGTWATSKSFVELELEKVKNQLNSIGYDENGKDLGYAYRNSFKELRKDVEKINDPSLIKLGKVISNMSIPSRVDESDPKNTVGVYDGQNPGMAIKMIGSISGRDIIDKLNYDGGHLQMGDNEDVKMMIKKGMINLKENEGVDPDKRYEIKYYGRVNINGTQGDDFDRTFYKGSKDFQNNLLGIQKHRADTMTSLTERARMINGLATDAEYGKDESGRTVTFKEIRETASASIKQMASQASASGDKNKASQLNTLASKLDNYKNLTPYQQQQVVQAINSLK